MHIKLKANIVCLRALRFHVSINEIFQSTDIDLEHQCNSVMKIEAYNSNKPKENIEPCYQY